MDIMCAIQIQRNTKIQRNTTQLSLSLNWTYDVHTFMDTPNT